MRRPGQIALMIATTLLLASGSTPASTVVPMTLPEVADHAAQVIVARVTAVESYWRDEPRTIETAVTFSHVEFLKGAWPAAGETFTLTVPGGTVGEVQLLLAHAPQFEPGQKWLLFLLPSYRTFPTVGLAQGALRIHEDAGGTERVYDPVGVPVAGIDADGRLRCIPKQDEKTNERNPAARLVGARGVRVHDRDANPAAVVQAASLAEFRAILQPILDASRDHHLARPAGQRVYVRFRGAPLEPADSNGADEPERAGAARVEQARPLVERAAAGRRPAAAAEEQP